MSRGAMVEPIKVFLSYRRADTQHVAGRFADKLDHRFAVFMDIDTIPPGVDFSDYVRRAVGNCDVLLAFIGGRWIELTDEKGGRRIDDPADWVAEEIRTALRRDVRVIPVLVDDASLPEPAALPDSLRPLASRQTLPLRHASFSADAARLITAIQSAAGTDGQDRQPYAARWENQPAPPPVQVVLPERTRRRRLPVIMAGIAVLAAILVIAGVVLWRSGNGAGPAAAASPPASSAPSTPPSTAEPSRPATATPGRARTTAQLRVLVPPALRTGCRGLQPEAEVLRAGLQTAIQCTPTPGSSLPQHLYYFSYRDSVVAERAFRAYYGAATLPPGDCTTADSETRYDTQGGRPATGSLRCYTDADGLAVFAWTNDQLAIVGSAADPRLGFSDLHQFWELAGPATGF